MFRRDVIIAFPLILVAQPLGQISFFEWFLFKEMSSHIVFNLYLRHIQEEILYLLRSPHRKEKSEFSSAEFTLFLIYYRIILL